MDKDDIDSLYTCNKVANSSGKKCYGTDNNPECDCSFKNYNEAYNYILEELYIIKIRESPVNDDPQRIEIARQKGIDALKRLSEGFPDELPTNEGWINTENANTEPWYGNKGNLYKGGLAKTSEGSICNNNDTCSLKDNQIAEGPFCDISNGKKEYCSFEHMAFSVPEGIEYLRKGLEELYLQENIPEEDAKKRSESKIKDRLELLKKQGIISQSVSIQRNELIRSDSGEIGYRGATTYVPKKGFKIEYTELKNSLVNKYSPEAEMRLLKKELSEIIKDKNDKNEFVPEEIMSDNIDTMSKDELINRIVTLNTFKHIGKFTLASAKQHITKPEVLDLGIKAFTMNAPMEDIMKGLTVTVYFTDITTGIEDPEWNSYVSVEGDIDIVGGEGNQEMIEGGAVEEEGTVEEEGQQEEGQQGSMILIMMKGLLVILIFVSCIALVMFGLNEFSPETYNVIIYEVDDVINEIEGVGDDIVSKIDDIMDDVKSIAD